MPRLEGETCYGRQAVRVAQHEPEAVRVAHKPSALGCCGETLLKNAAIARAYVGGEPGLMLAVACPRTGDIGLSLAQCVHVILIGVHLSVVRAVGTLQPHSPGTLGVGGREHCHNGGGCLGAHQRRVRVGDRGVDEICRGVARRVQWSELVHHHPDAGGVIDRPGRLVEAWRRRRRGGGRRWGLGRLLRSACAGRWGHPRLLLGRPERDDRPRSDEADNRNRGDSDKHPAPSHPPGCSASRPQICHAVSLGHANRELRTGQTKLVPEAARRLRMTAIDSGL